jgi:hypothetical protein
MLSKQTQFLWVAIVVIGTIFLFNFASYRLDNTAIAGQAIFYGPECEAETDAGLDISNFGEVYIPSVDVTMKDVCVDNFQLLEFECTDKGVVKEYFFCSKLGYSCLDGVCVSDSGKSGKEHIVLLDDSGFSPDELTIAIGDTVTWVNVRVEFDSALLIGAQKNTHIKSEMLSVGESYSYTFSEEEMGRNVFVDGILISYESFVYVE